MPPRDAPPSPSSCTSAVGRHRVPGERHVVLVDDRHHDLGRRCHVGARGSAFAGLVVRTFDSRRRRRRQRRSSRSGHRTLHRCGAAVRLRRPAVRQPPIALASRRRVVHIAGSAHVGPGGVGRRRHACRATAARPRAGPAPRGPRSGPRRRPHTTAAPAGAGAHTGSERERDERHDHGQLGERGEERRSPVCADSAALEKDQAGRPVAPERPRVPSGSPTRRATPSSSPVPREWIPRDARGHAVGGGSTATARFTRTWGRAARAGCTAYERGAGSERSVRGSDGRRSSTRMASVNWSTERAVARWSRRRSQYCAK